MDQTKQQMLTEWTAGFFDGEGALDAHIGSSDSCDIGHAMTAQARVVHTYMGGLFDSEGCVKMGIGKAPGATIGYNSQAEASIGHTANDALISALKSFAERTGFNCSIYHRDGRDNRADNFIWRVHTVNDVKAFLNSIKGYSIVKSPEIKIMLEQIIPRMESKNHRHKRGFLELVAWRDVLNSYKGGTRGKYNLAYFEDLWDMELEPDKIPARHPKA